MRGKPFEKENKFGKGRPLGSRNKRTLLADTIEQHGDAIIKQCVVMALKCNPVAMRLCMDWLARYSSSRRYDLRLPRVKTADDLPAAWQALAKAVAQGRLGVSEAHLIANIQEKLLRAIEKECLVSSSVEAREPCQLDLTLLNEEQLAMLEQFRRVATGRKEP